LVESDGCLYAAILLACQSQMAASSLVILWELKAADAAEFFCPSGNVTCLIAALNEANGMAGEHIINLEPGSYTLQAIDLTGFRAMQMGYR
jgi:hypothetical protein